MIVLITQNTSSSMPKKIKKINKGIKNTAKFLIILPAIILVLVVDKQQSLFN